MTFGKHKIRATLMAVIMITSVMAVGGLGSAQVQSGSEDQTIDPTDPTAGDQVQVTVEATANSSSRMTFISQFSQETNGSSIV